MCSIVNPASVFMFLQECTYEAVYGISGQGVKARCLIFFKFPSNMMVHRNDGETPHSALHLYTTAVRELSMSTQNAGDISESSTVKSVMLAQSLVIICLGDLS